MSIKNTEKSKGITLIALVVTIIVLIILAGISLNLLSGNRGIVGRAEETAFKQKLAQISEEWSLVKAGMAINFENTKINAGSVLEDIITVEELEGIDVDSVEDIHSILKQVGSTEEKYIMIMDGELYYVSQPNLPNNAEQTKWAEDLGIKIYEFAGVATGIQVINGNYELVNGIYLCTPKLDTGFSKYHTRYAYTSGSNGEYMTVGSWINKKPNDNWYDYKNKKWANLYVESNGSDSYYVWIPRYVYKQDTVNSVSGNERTDVKFVDTDNSYKDPETDAVTTWEELQNQGYILPEAFIWGEDGNERNIPGYWISKYQLTELTNDGDYVVDFATAATTTTITIQDITTHTSKVISKYTYAVNGKIIHESTNGEQFKITGLAKGDRAVNVTLLDSNNQVIGSMTKLYSAADVNEPDLTGFDEYNTFYVWWDENGIEHNETPISKAAPAEWYDYSVRSWANIVTRNNGTDSYFVWIPRYEYALDTVTQRTYVRFIKGTGTVATSGYTIPEAFTWGEGSTTKELTGFWISKYQLSEKNTSPALKADIALGDTSATVGTISGTAVTNNTNNIKFEYYIDGTKVHDGDNLNEGYVYRNLTPKTTYGLTIIAKNKTTNAYLGAITNKITTPVINAPELVGFNVDRTYIVIYNNDLSTISKYYKLRDVLNSGATIENNVLKQGNVDKTRFSETWYDYSTKNWANIVTTDGTVSGNSIAGATSTSYFVWIPRYQYMLDTVNQRVDVKFIEGTGTTAETGYTIPEAFTWGEGDNIRELTGYWESKYQLSN